MCRLDSGEIEFIGREDFQVKVGGHRIELGEIENTLKNQPGIKEAVVEAIGERDCEKQLVAYWVSTTDQNIKENELRSFLQQKLPAYMVPATFVRLEVLPLNPNGKVDRKALPKTSEISQSREYIAPSNDYEITLAKIWGEVLNIEKISVLDNFFELGGDSLLATQIMTRVRSRFSFNVSIRILFENATIQSLANYIERHAVKVDIQTQADHALVTEDI